MKNKSSAIAEVEKYHQEQLILSATHSAFGELPIDERYLPIMQAFIRGTVAEALEKRLMSLLHEVMQDGGAAVIKAVNDNRVELSEAIREYSKLTNPYEE